jgi:phenylacetate-CoA ligase
MGSFTLSEILEHARRHSPFYAELYRGIREHGADIRLEDLPIIDQSAFWAANSMENNRLLTGPIDGGVVYKSGGTTGNPKFSVFTKGEWEAFCMAFGWGMDRGGLRDGDRVANLFYAGELYASFLFITKSIELARARATNFPMTGSSSPELIAKTVEEFKIDTLAGVPTTVLSFAQYVLAHELRLPSVRRVLFGGESMYPDQRAMLARAFPGVSVSSIGYASVDAGLLGFADETCGPEEHRVFGSETIIELVDEDTGEVIREPGRAGKLILTNLTRKLMPVIRYPAGDRAMWVEADGGPSRKFALLGRSEEAARVGPVSLYFDDVRQVIAELPAPAGIGGFQMVLTHEEGRDRLTIRIAVTDPRSVSPGAARDLEARLFAARPLLGQIIASGKALPLRIEWLSASELAVNPRTGKLRRMVDERR